MRFFDVVFDRLDEAHLVHEREERICAYSPNTTSDIECACSLSRRCSRSTIRVAVVPGFGSLLRDCGDGGQPLHDGEQEHAARQRVNLREMTVSSHHAVVACGLMCPVVDTALQVGVLLRCRLDAVGTAGHVADSSLREEIVEV